MKLNEVKQKVGKFVGKMPKPTKLKAFMDSAYSKYKAKYEDVAEKIFSKCDVVKIVHHAILSAVLLSVSLLAFKLFGWGHYSILAAVTPLIVVWCFFGIVFSVMVLTE